MQFSHFIVNANKNHAAEIFFFLNSVLHTGFMATVVSQQARASLTHTALHAPLGG